MVSSSAPSHLLPISGVKVTSTNISRIPRKETPQFQAHNLGADQPTVVQGPAGDSRTLRDSFCLENDVARMFFRCQGTRTITHKNKFDGNWL